MLFAITECATVSNHTYTQHILFIRHCETEAYRNRLPGFYRESLALSGNHFIRHRIKKNKFRSSLQRFTCQIGNGCSNAGLIPYPYKTRHIGRQHEVLRRNSRSLQLTGQHSLCMGISAEIPTRQTLWHRKGEGNLTLFIGAQLRIEERRFSEVCT